MITNTASSLPNYADYSPRAVDKRSLFDVGTMPVRSRWAVTALLARLSQHNPRYTGRQIWNRQRTDEVLLDVNDVELHHTAIMRWKRPDQWGRLKKAASGHAQWRHSRGSSGQ